MRADVYIASGGYAKSREAAKKLIESGRVTIDGNKVSKPSVEVDDALPHTVEVERPDEFVSRGGLKLKGALDAFSISVEGWRAVDIGASTGGFTHCLLERGAAAVYAVDSGHGQLDAALREHPCVVNVEGYNARRLCEDGPTDLPGDLDGAVMDVSFISQTYILPGIPRLLRQGGLLVSLIKPQFEAGRGAVGKGGIVRDPADRLFAVRRVLDCAEASGFGFVGLIKSPITGGDGNVEYLTALCYGGGSEFPTVDRLEKII